MNHVLIGIYYQGTHDHGKQLYYISFGVIDSNHNHLHAMIMRYAVNMTIAPHHGGEQPHLGPLVPLSHTMVLTWHIGTNMS